MKKLTLEEIITLKRYRRAHGVRHGMVMKDAVKEGKTFAEAHKLALEDDKTFYNKL